MSFDIDEPRTDEVHLGLFLSAGPHGVGGWRHPEDDAGWTSAKAYAEIGRIAEAAKFDLIFVADSLAVPRALRDSPDDQIRYGVGVPRLDPIPVLSIISAATEHIGVVATSSTTFGQPYALARTLASLDLLSDGRAGWNIVTSFQDSEAHNFGLDALPPRDERYARAEEFVEVAAQLWDSWGDDAVVFDRASGIYADPDRVDSVDHAGERYRVRGPLSTPRTPQGYPLLVQAGSSPSGRDFAARWADTIFCSHESIDSAIDFYRDVKERAVFYGREADHIKILPSVSPIVAASQESAAEKVAAIRGQVVPEAGLARLSYHIDVDLSQFDLDRPLPQLDVPGVHGHYREAREITDREGLTLRELGIWYGSRTEGHLIGDATTIADGIEEWFQRRAADGFMVSAHYLPGALQEFAGEVVPELQRRGLFRRDYTGATLRENLGVPRPARGEWRSRVRPS